MNNPLAMNFEEGALGAIFGLSLAFFIGWLALIPAVACGFLWAYGGSGAGKAWRRVGVPLVALAAIVLARLPVDLFQALVMTGIALAVLTLGYGTPSTQPPDEGSTLGKFFFAFVKDPMATYLTRGTISLLLAAAYAPLAVVMPHEYIGFVLVLVVGQHLAVRFVEGVFYL